MPGTRYSTYLDSTCQDQARVVLLFHSKVPLVSAASSPANPFSGSLIVPKAILFDPLGMMQNLSLPPSQKRLIVAHGMSLSTPLVAGTPEKTSASWGYSSRKVGSTALLL